MGQRISSALRMSYTQEAAQDSVEWPYTHALVAALTGGRELKKTAHDTRRQKRWEEEKRIEMGCELDQNTLY